LNKPKVVWAVTEGDYSDYRVRCLFTTEKLAEQHKDNGGGDTVEEFLLLDRLPVKKTIYSINARIRPDGSVTAEHRDGGEPEVRTSVEFEAGSYQGILKPIMEARTLQAPYAGKDWLVRVSGTDKAKVLKSFHDRVGQAKARTLGVEA
jgi:hypothetical protein